MESLFRVVESSMPLFADAYLLDGERWVFGSFWGHETALQEFFARLTLPNHEDGLRSFSLESPAGERVKINAGQIGDLTKITTRTPPTTVLGTFCHVWIFDPALQQPNRRNGEAFVLGLPEETSEQILRRAWSTIQELSQLPLLDHWRDELMQLLIGNEWIMPLSGEGVQGFRISLPAEALEAAVSDGFKRKIFAVEPVTPVVAVQQGNLF
jgi:hypothetical protein